MERMLQALSTPVFKSILLATVALSLGAAYVGTRDHAVSRRLVLHAVDEPGAVYLSAWRDGDLNVELASTELTPITLHIRADVSDGCRWLGIEKELVPIDATTFHYDYNETILECEPGSTPARRRREPASFTVH